MKRLTAAVAAVLVLSACGGTGGGAQKVADAPGDNDKVTLTVWSGFDDKELAALDAVLDGFHQKHPNITITSQGSQDDDKISQAVRGGTAPDVAISSNANALGQYCKTGAFQNLQGYLDRDKVDLSVFPQAVRDYTEHDDVRCAMPLLADAYGLYYNKTLFAEAGITAPPKTMTELAAAAKKLTKFNADGSIKVAGFVPTLGFYNNRVDVWAPQFGAEWQDSRGKSSLSTSPGWTNLFQWQKQLTDFYTGAQGITPLSWRTVGDSRTDYAMADWLHHNDHDVKHVDVRPADGVPVKPYTILTAADLDLAEDVIHDDAGGAFLRSWREALAI